jgi:hypothetical protein
VLTRLRQRWHDTAAWERLLWVRVHDLGAAARALRLGAALSRTRPIIFTGTRIKWSIIATNYSTAQIKHSSDIQSISDTSTVSKKWALIFRTLF